MDKRKPTRFLILTGAGISVRSGLRPFRGKDGMSNDPNIVRLAHKDALYQDIDGVWRLFGGLRQEALTAEPNIAHRAVAEFERHLGSERVLVVTQNIDGLHQKAGSKNVVEFHGSMLRSRCRNPHCKLQPFADEDSHDGKVPLCPICHHPMRPDIVFFGERPAPESREAVTEWLRDHDFFIAIGTSLTVIPAANFVKVACDVGATTISVNSEPVAPALRKYFRQEIIGPTEEKVPELLEDLANAALINTSQ